MKLVRKNPAPLSSSSHPRPAAAQNARPQTRRAPARHPQSPSRPLPRPRRAGVGKGLAAAALLSILAVVAVGYWVTRDDEQRDALRRDAGALLRRTTQGTPLEGLAARLLPAEDAPGLSSGGTAVELAEAPDVSPAEDGFLAGQVITAPVTPPPAVPSDEPLPVPPQLRSDDRVTPTFVTDLARFFVARYAASGGGGPLSLSVRQLNQHYGSRLTGLAAGGGDVQARRAAILRYAFHPAMLQALYDIYADRFLDAVIREAMRPAGGKGLSEAQTQRLCLAVGGRLVLLAGALDGIRKTPDVPTLLSAVETRAQEAQAAMERMQGEMLRMEELQARGGNAVAVARSRIVADKEAAAYRAALQGRDEARRAVAAAVRRAGGQGLDDATLLYLAEWVDRRLRTDAGAGETVGVAARLLRDLGRRFAQAGTQGLPEPLEQRLAREQREAAAARAAARNGALQSAPQAAPGGAPTIPAIPAAPGSVGTPQPRIDTATPQPPAAPPSRERLLSRPPALPAGGALTPPVPRSGEQAGEARP